jgi:aspartyl-tRNA(Asn)/glutamyl-tRNA(Gln) amidotransferase subunit B
MEEGSLRMDANVSIRPAGTDELGTKAELKNMNSFRFLERGIDAEIARQTQIVEDGGAVVQETLHFDPVSGQISSLRSKEEAHDYRYFPEPDLVPIAPTEEMLERARVAIPELPAARADRLERDHGLHPDTARLLAFRGDLGDYFEEAVDGADARQVANWITGDLVARTGAAPVDTWKVKPRELARLVNLVSDRTVSASAAKEVLDVMLKEGGDPEAIVESKGLGRADSSELEGIVDQAIADQADAVEKIKAGNDRAIGAIVGAVMRETKGRADGGEVQRMIRERIGA